MDGVALTVWMHTVRAGAFGPLVSKLGVLQLTGLQFLTLSQVEYFSLLGVRNTLSYSLWNLLHPITTHDIGALCCSVSRHSLVLLVSPVPHAPFEFH